MKAPVLLTLIASWLGACATPDSPRTQGPESRGSGLHSTTASPALHHRSSPKSEQVEPVEALSSTKNFSDLYTTLAGERCHQFDAKTRLELSALHLQRYAENSDSADLAVAERQLRDVISRHPRDARAWELLARLYFERARRSPAGLGLAELVLTRAFDLNCGARANTKACSRLHNLRGVIALTFGNDPGAALKDFEAALTFDPELEEAHRNLGFLSLQLHLDQVASEHFEAARRLSDGPIDAPLLVASGLSSQRMGDFHGALSFFDQAIAKSPDNPWPLFFYARVEQIGTTGCGPLDAAEEKIFKVFQMTRYDPRYQYLAREVERDLPRDSFPCLISMAELEEQAKALAEREKREAQLRRERLLDLEQRALHEARERRKQHR